jgi:kelch-like protein 2/3
MVYDVDMNLWSHVGYLSGEDMFNNQFSRFGFACESIEDRLYIIGGMRISRHNRNFVHALNTTEVCVLPLQGQSKFTLWHNMANMGDSEGNVLASAVLKL